MLLFRQKDEVSGQGEPMEPLGPSDPQQVGGYRLLYGQRGEDGWKAL
jgi:hypothetical protein